MELNVINFSEPGLPKVSICIPAYNQVKYLKRTIDSVLSQSYTDYEIIITDDSTTDIVFGLIEEYKLPGIFKYYKNSPALGTPENWNESLRKAKGEYIKIMHHDDWFTDEQSLSEFVHAMDENPNCNFAFSSSVGVDIANNKRWIRSSTQAQVDKLRKDPYSLFFGNFIGTPSSTIHKRNTSLYYDINLKWVVDYEFYIQQLIINQSFVFIEKPLVTCIYGDEHNVTNDCENNMHVEISEYLYLLNKLSKSNKRIFLKKSYASYLQAILLKYDFKSAWDIRDAGFTEKIPLSLQMLLFLRRAKLGIKWRLRYSKKILFTSIFRIK